MRQWMPLVVSLPIWCAALRFFWLAKFGLNHDPICVIALHIVHHIFLNAIRKRIR